MSLVRRKLLEWTIRGVLKPKLRNATFAQQRKMLEWWMTLGWVPRDVQVEQIEIGGRTAERLRPQGSEPTSQTILMLHGGGYCWCGLATHREFAARIARAARTPVVILDYRLAPEHPYPAAVEDATAAFTEMVEDYGSAQNVAVIGDSAGGGLALAMCLRLRKTEHPLPACLGLVSPWVDLTLGGKSCVSLINEDPLLAPEPLQRCAAAYAGDYPLQEAEISPLFADLRGLPPMLVQVGSNEILLDDSQRLVESIRRSGGTVELNTAQNLWHVWHLFASALPEAVAGIERLADFVSRHFEHSAR